MAEKCTCRVLTARYCPVHSKFAKEKMEQTYKVIDYLDEIEALEAGLARCQGNLQAMTEDYITEGQQLRDDLTALRKAVAEVHVIIYKQATPVRAYFSKTKAMADYDELKQADDTGPFYGVISMPVEDASDLEKAIKAGEGE